MAIFHSKSHFNSAQSHLLVEEKRRNNQLLVLLLLKVSELLPLKMQGTSAPLGTEILASANSSAAKLRAWPCLGESTQYSSTPLHQGKFMCAVVRGFLDALNSLDVPTLYFTWLQSIQGNEFKLRCQKIFLVSSTRNVVGTTEELWKDQVHGRITVFTKPVCCYT